MRRQLFATVLSLVAIAAVGSAAHAQSTISQTISVSGSGYEALNFDDTSTFSFTKFDTTLGTLNSITITISAKIKSDIGIENLTNQSVANAYGTVQGVFSVDDPLDSNNTLVTAAPSVKSSKVNLGPYDGTTDFSGSSGASFTGLTSTSATGLTSVTDASELTAFSTSSGAGNIVLEVEGSGSSSATGPASYASSLTNSAGAPVVTITYNYTSSAMPEPGTLGMVVPGLGMVLAGAGVYRRRRAPRA